MSKQQIILADGVTEKECAVIRLHGFDLFQSLRFIGFDELDTP